MATDTQVFQVTDAGRPASPPGDGRPAPPTWLRVGLPLLLVLVSGALRFQDLSHPERRYFDEVYYAEDAADYLELGVEGGRAVHPMVGKWIIAGGIAAFGNNSFGWRFASAVAGTLTVLVLYLIGVRLFRRRGIAALAALLLSLDGMAFTASRISMLDVFLTLFILAGFWLLLIDRDRLWAPLDEEQFESGEPPGASAQRPAGRALGRSTPLVPIERVAAGLAFGLAVSTKWSGLLAIGGAGLFVIGAEYAWRRRVTGTVKAGWWRPLVSAALTLLVVPLLIYVVTHASWFANYENTQPGISRCGADAVECAVPAGDIFGDWLGEQADNYRFHRDLEAEHRYRAEAWTWPTLSRPVAYYYESCKPDRAEDAGPCVVGEGMVEEILGIGNPGVWWVALVLGYPVVVWGLIRRDWRAWAIAALLAAQYVPWLIAPRPLFLFYTVPLLPFVALALAYGAGELSRHEGLRWIPGTVATVAVAGFIFWWPLFVGAPITEGAWRLRILFDSWI